MTSFSVYNDKYSLDDVTSDVYVVVVSWVGHETNVVADIMHVNGCMDRGLFLV